MVRALANGAARVAIVDVLFIVLIVGIKIGGS